MQCGTPKADAVGAKEATASRDVSDESLNEHTITEPYPPLPVKLATRIDLHVVAPLVIVYLTSFLDRVNISSALIFGLPQDLHLHGSQINIALALLFVTYVTCEIPATIVMKKTKPQYFLPTCTVLFGLLLTLHGVVSNYASLIALRVLMGAFEAAIYPSCYYLISMWYRRHEAQKRFTLFFAGASLAGAFGSLIATGIGHMDGVGGYRAWRWIFILEGLMTLVIAFLAFFTISDFPEHARWLSNSERELVVNRLALDQGSSGIRENIRFNDLTLILKDWRILLSGPLYFGIATSIYGLAYFIPTIITTYGYSPIEAQLHSVIPWAAALAWSFAAAYLSDYLQMRSPFVVISICFALIGNLLLFNLHSNHTVGLAGLFLYLMGVIGANSVFICWFSMNLVGHKERSVGIPYMVGVGNASGIVGVFAFPPSSAPNYRLGYSLGLGFLLFSLALTFFYVVVYSLENKRGLSQVRKLL